MQGSNELSLYSKKQICTGLLAAAGGLLIHLVVRAVPPQAAQHAPPKTACELP